MAEEEDYSSLSITDRATHKIWKVRLQAYEEINKEFATSSDEGAPCFRPWLNDPSLWRKIVTDSNAVAQEAGLSALCNFIEFGGNNAAVKTRPFAIPGIVEKCLSSARAGTKAKAIEALLLFVEVDTPDPVLEDLIPGFSAKLPKLVAATTTAMKEIYRQFGTRTVNPKPALKQLPKLFAHSDKTVRAEASTFAVVLYTWLGDAIRPSLAELKPLQLKELDEAFATVEPGKATQERFLRTQKAAQQGGVAEPEDEEPVVVDAFDLAEPVDIRRNLPPEFNDWVVSTKWKERKDALDALLTNAKVPRIKEENYSEIMGILGRCMKDANIVVVTVAANCVEAIARGLRKPFGQYKHFVMQAMVEKLKERKQSVVDAIANAMDGVFIAVGLTDILEETQQGLQHKNPQVKTESLRFLVRCLRTTPFAPTKAETQIIGESCTKLLSDTFEPVRTAAAEAMGTLMKIVGERAMIQFLDGVDEIRKSKIKEAFEKAEIKARQRPVATKNPATGAGGARKPVPIATGGGGGGATARPGVKPGAGGPARPTSLKRPGSTASVDKEPDSPKKPGIARPGMKPPGTAMAAPAPAAPTSRLAARQSLAPPRMGSPTPVAPKKPLVEDPPPAAAPKLGRQLLGRSVVTPTELPMTNPERAELDILRAEKSRWESLREEDRAERARILQEVNELRSQNAEMVENHTRDLLQMKAKETQLARSRNDVELTQAALSKAQRDLEVLRQSSTADSARELEAWKFRAEKAEQRILERDTLDQSVMGRLTDLEEFIRGLDEETPDAEDVSRLSSRCRDLEEQNRRLLAQMEEYTSRINSLEESVKRRTTSPLRNGNYPYSSRSSTSFGSEDEKENAYSKDRKYATLSSSGGSNSGRTTGGIGSLDQATNEIHSWRSAAEVTAALKMKIEQMRRADSKNRQGF